MKMYGIERKIDELGRLTIPKQYREQLNLTEGATAVVSYTKGGIVVKPKVPNMKKERLLNIVFSLQTGTAVTDEEMNELIEYINKR